MTLDEEEVEWRVKHKRSKKVRGLHAQWQLVVAEVEVEVDGGGIPMMRLLRRRPKPRRSIVVVDKNQRKTKKRGEGGEWRQAPIHLLQKCSLEKLKISLRDGEENTGFSNFSLFTI